MRFRMLLAATLAGAVLAGGLVAPALAATPDVFDPGYIISDEQFFDSTSMDEDEIQDFLVERMSLCAPVQGVPCLKNYATATQSLPATSRCTAYDGSISERASRVIHRVALACGINPKVLCFELTESAAVANLARAEVMMKRLRELGCTIALDDFGTGLSSLQYLRALPIDMLKIDGSFVRDVLKDPRAESMVQAMAQLARSMNLITVAEYVETEEIRLRVARLGVDYGQGFAIAKPAPLAEALSMLPTYVLMARAGAGGSEEIVLSAEDDTIASEFAALRRELNVAHVMSAEETPEQIALRMERILAGYDHGDSALYQQKEAG